MRYDGILIPFRNQIPRIYQWFLIQIFLASHFGIQCSWIPSSHELKAGPMVGAVSMQSALIWAQVKEEEIGEPFPFNHINNPYLKEAEETLFSQLPVLELIVEEDKEESLFSLLYKMATFQRIPVMRFYSSPHPVSGIVIFEVNGLKPGTTYAYSLKGYRETDGKFTTKPFWKFRQKQPPDFSFLIASCHYVNDPDFDRIGEPYGGGYEIFQSIQKENASFFLWLGDNVYLREPDWDSPYGILRRYSHTRALPESKGTFRNMPHFAIWDDHDFGPNDSSYAYSLSQVTTEYFKQFWPDFSYPEKGIYRSFTWGDAEFFLLDNRTFRTANQNKVYGKKTILGEKQLDWLIQGLSDSTARVKFIVLGGQFLNSEPVYENYANYAEEREQILQILKKINGKNIVFLTGDRHHSEVSFYPFPSGWGYGNKKNAGFYEFTVSPLTAGVHPYANQEKNQYRLPDSLFSQRVYGKIELLSNPDHPESRILRFTLKNTQGEAIYTYSLDLD